jgi:hypothetical protein
MIHHHTETKGDMGVGMVISDLMQNGIFRLISWPFLPLARYVVFR